MNEGTDMELIDRLNTQVVEMPELEQAFRQNNQGWLGSDCAFSLPLSKERVLWLFGDTFIGDSSSNSVSRSAATIINSTIGIQSGSLLSQSPSLRFYWQQHQGSPQSFFQNNSLPGYLWPLSAALVHGKLYVFTVRIVQSDVNFAFGFEQIGNEIICIDNPDDEPENWKMTPVSLPFIESGVSFASYALIEDDFLYIYGYRKEGKSWQSSLSLMIARVNIKQIPDISDMNNWQFLDGFTFQWTDDIQNIRPVFQHSSTELSVSYLAKLDRYVLVHNAWKYPNSILIRLAETPFGPFSRSRIIYDCPEIKWDDQYFCYAAKAHPELAEEDDEIIISYMTNSKLLELCVNDVRIYYPRFIKLKVKI